MDDIKTGWVKKKHILAQTRKVNQALIFRGNIQVVELYGVPFHCIYFNLGLIKTVSLTLSVKKKSAKSDLNFWI